jgi:hypothetical protein
MKRSRTYDSLADSNKQIKHDVKSNAGIGYLTSLHRDSCTFHSLQHLRDLLTRQLREKVFGGKVCHINRNTLMLYNMTTGRAYKLRHEHAEHQELKMITQLHDYRVVCCTNSRIYIWKRDLSSYFCVHARGAIIDLCPLRENAGIIVKTIARIAILDLQDQSWTNINEEYGDCGVLQLRNGDIVTSHGKDLFWLTVIHHDQKYKIMVDIYAEIMVEISYNFICMSWGNILSIWDLATRSELMRTVTSGNIHDILPLEVGRFVTLCGRDVVLWQGLEGETVYQATRYFHHLKHCPLVREITTNVIMFEDGGMLVYFDIDQRKKVKEKESPIPTVEAILM